MGSVNISNTFACCIMLREWPLQWVSDWKKSILVGLGGSLPSVRKLRRDSSSNLRHGLSKNGPYSRVRDLLYAKFYLLLVKNEEVKKLGCKLSVYMWGHLALDTNPSMVSSKITFVLTLTLTLWNSKLSLNHELNESPHAWANLTGASETKGPLIRMLITFTIADSNVYRIL